MRICTNYEEKRRNSDWDIYRPFSRFIQFLTDSPVFVIMSRKNSLLCLLAVVSEHKISCFARKLKFIAEIIFLDSSFPQFSFFLFAQVTSKFSDSYFMTSILDTLIWQKKRKSFILILFLPLFAVKEMGDLSPCRLDTCLVLLNFFFACIVNSWSVCFSSLLERSLFK